MASADHSASRPLNVADAAAKLGLSETQKVTYRSLVDTVSGVVTEQFALDDPNVATEIGRAVVDRLNDHVCAALVLGHSVVLQGVGTLIPCVRKSVKRFHPGKMRVVHRPAVRSIRFKQSARLAQALREHRMR